MEEKKGWLETRRYVCRKCGSSMIIESSGIRHWECTKCHTVNYEENYLENKLKQELDRAREEGRREVYEAIVFDKNIPHDVTTFVAANLWKNMRDKAKEELSKLTTK